MSRVASLFDSPWNGCDVSKHIFLVWYMNVKQILSSLKAKLEASAREDPAKVELLCQNKPETGRPDEAIASIGDTFRMTGRLMYKIEEENQMHHLKWGQSWI